MRIHLSRSIVPNLFTVLNIFFGFLCMVQAAQGKFVLATWYVLLSAVCDTLDGLMARLTRSASEFGVELDSLADVVAFGAAPSFLAYSLVFHQYPTFGPLIAATPLIFGALRLARFNVQLTGFSKEYFSGVPIPLSALTIVSFVQFFGPDAIVASRDLQHVFTGVIIACGILMVSTIRYPVLPRPTPAAFREHPVQMTLLVAAGIAIVATGGRALFPVFAGVILLGAAAALGRQLNPRTRTISAATSHPDETPVPSDTH